MSIQYILHSYFYNYIFNSIVCVFLLSIILSVYLKFCLLNTLLPAPWPPSFLLPLNPSQNSLAIPHSLFSKYLWLRQLSTKTTGAKSHFQFCLSFLQAKCINVMCFFLAASLLCGCMSVHVSVCKLFFFSKYYLYPHTCFYVEKTFI